MATKRTYTQTSLPNKKNKKEKDSEKPTKMEKESKGKKEEKTVVESKEKSGVETILIDEFSTLKWCPDFLEESEAKSLYDHLMEVLNFEQSEISMYGKKIKLPRLQAWFAEEGMVVKELFQKQPQKPWTEPVQKVREKIESLAGFKFDYCLVNYYRDGNDHIGYHADNEAKDVVASLSLGGTRKFDVQHLSCFGKVKTRKGKPLEKPETDYYQFSLTNGSLIVMLGGTQQYWKHRIPKEPSVKTQRINLTFRTKK